MAIRNYLRVTAFLMLLLLAEAVNRESLKAAKRELKPLVHRALRELRNESICNNSEVHPVGCLTELKSNASDCRRVSAFDVYVTEATNLDVQALVTEQLQAINQYLQGFRNVLCESEPEAAGCDVAFTESDGDYEKVCKVTRLLVILSRWLSR